MHTSTITQFIVAACACVCFAHIAAEAVLAVTQFADFPRGSRTKARFTDFVHSLNGPELTKLLLFVTAQSAVPSANQVITVMPMEMGVTGRDPDRTYPVARTCFHRLELPEYSSREIMSTHLRFCLDNVEKAGFGLI